MILYSQLGLRVYYTLLHKNLRTGMEYHSIELFVVDKNTLQNYCHVPGVKSLRRWGWGVLHQGKLPLVSLCWRTFRIFKTLSLTQAKNMGI